MSKTPEQWAMEYYNLKSFAPNTVTGLIGKFQQAMQQVWDEALEEAAKAAEDFPINFHGALSTDPTEAGRQVCREITSGIRALKNKESK